MTGREDRDSDAWTILRGGAVNFVGFLVRGGGRIPFIFIAGNFFGAEAVGRFAAVAVILQFAAAVAVFGMKRSLFEALHRDDPDRAPAILINGLAVALAFGALSAGAAALLVGGGAVWIVVAIPAIAATDILLVGTRYKKLLRYQVLARSVAEPWTLSLLTLAAALVLPTAAGLLLAYAGALLAGLAVAGVGFYLHILRGPGGAIRLDRRLMISLVRLSAPTALVDIIENLFRRIDLFVLSLFSPGAAVGVYYLARQIAFLIQNVKQGFDPILAPVIAGIAFQDGMGRAAGELARVSRWIFTLQLALVIAIAVPGAELLTLLGEGFAAGWLILILLLTAELIDGTAAPWELAILYARRRLNLAFSAIAFMLYAGLCLLLAREFGGAGAAGAFLIGLACLAALRLTAVSRLFGATVLPAAFARPSIAGGAACLAGILTVTATGASPPVAVAATIPAALAVYAFALRLAGFDDEDKALFSRLRGRAPRP